MVACGMGLAIVSRMTVLIEVEAGVLGILPLKDLKIHRPFHIQRLLGRNQNPSQLKFLETLKLRLS
jgi:DNA-binding transcriptional LysR family regulator